jgi:SulP family sulfate permease
MVALNGAGYPKSSWMRQGMTYRFFEPELFSVFRKGYSRTLFVQDLSAGLIVGIVALPLAIAFAIASGVKPEQGLYTAVFAGFFISLLSGSRVQIGGPTGAFVVLVYSVVQKYGYDGLAVATLLAGFILVLMGICQFGMLIKFIPYPVTVGFTTGIALIIASSQVRDALGLTMQEVPAGFVEKWLAYSRHLASFHWLPLLVCLGTVIIIVYWPRTGIRIPGSLVAILLSTVLVQLFDLPVETIGSRFGGVPAVLPMPRIPRVDWSLLPELISPAIAIALLGGIESLLSAVVADGMTGRRHHSNTELIAQGVANVISPIFGGIPATGAIARTATNIKSGGQTPVAGLVHALTLMIILLVAGKWAAMIPMAALAGILLVVAYNMSEIHLFLKVFASTKSDTIVLVTTFALTVFVDLTVAIQVGVVLASFLFMRRMAEVTQAGFITQMLNDENDSEDLNPLSTRVIPSGVEVFEINGPFFFGAADKFKNALREMEQKPEVLIFRMRRVLSMDATGLRALEELHARTRKEGTLLLLSGVHAQPLILMTKSGFLRVVGMENVFGNIDSALDRAREFLNLPPGPHVTGFPEVRREMPEFEGSIPNRN